MSALFDDVYRFSLWDYVQKSESRTYFPMNEQVTLIRSSLIRSISYDRQYERLSVVFEDGASVIYVDVPIVIYKGLLNARSAGAYFNQNVKGKYDVYLPQGTY